jgi:polysaccharide export outer membrane protein
MKSSLLLAASFLLAAGVVSQSVTAQTTNSSVIKLPADPLSPSSTKESATTSAAQQAAPAASAPAAAGSVPGTSPAPPDLTFHPAPGTELPLTKPEAPKTVANVPAGAIKNSAETADLAPYVLGPNDVIAVSVFGEGNLSGTYAVGPDGRISMPLINDFKAVGMTVRELSDLIAKKLEDFILDPVVNVQLLRNNSKKYTLVGGLGKTGPVQLTQQTTVLDALAAAGGFKDFANEKKIVIRRGARTFNFNYKDVIRGKHMEQNINLEDGDLIIVPE